MRTICWQLHPSKWNRIKLGSNQLNLRATIRKFQHLKRLIFQFASKEKISHSLQNTSGLHLNKHFNCGWVFFHLWKETAFIFNWNKSKNFSICKILRCTYRFTSEANLILDMSCDAKSNAQTKDNNYLLAYYSVDYSNVPVSIYLMAHTLKSATHGHWFSIKADECTTADVLFDLLSFAENIATCNVKCIFTHHQAFLNSASYLLILPRFFLKGIVWNSEWIKR